MQFYCPLRNLKLTYFGNTYRYQLDCVYAILKIIEFLQTKGTIEYKCPNAPYLFVDTDKLHRVFIVKHNSIESFCSPFDCKEENKKLKFQLYRQPLTPEIISNCMALVNEFKSKKDYNLDYCEIFEFMHGVEGVEDITNYTKISQWLFVKLLITEMGYFRYDDDPQHHNELVHPRYHIDINMSKLITYKIGLHEKLSLEKLKKIIKKKEEENKKEEGAWYLYDYTNSWRYKLKIKFKAFIKKICYFPK